MLFKLSHFPQNLMCNKEIVFYFSYLGFLVAYSFVSKGIISSTIMTKLGQNARYGSPLMTSFSKKVAKQVTNVRGVDNWTGNVLLKMVKLTIFILYSSIQNRGHCLSRICHWLQSFHWRGLKSTRTLWLLNCPWWSQTWQSKINRGDLCLCFLDVSPGRMSILSTHSTRVLAHWVIIQK